MSLLRHRFAGPREIEMRVGDFVLTAGSLRRSTSHPSGPFPTAVSFVRDGWSAFDSGAQPFSGCSHRFLTLASHLFLRWFRPAWLRVHPGFIFKFSDLR
ncbi:hypothetical protein Bca4012_071424 [Brassica carinata]